MNKADYPYADYAASRPLRPEVRDALLTCWQPDQAGVTLGNPAARQHASGRRAFRLLQAAREQLADFFSVSHEEIYFTSGATESCNLAILGTFQRSWQQRPDLVSVATEHAAVLEPLAHCQAANPTTQLHLAPVDHDGHCAWDDLPLTEKTGLVAAMAVNNETGVVHDLHALHPLCQQHATPLLIDATQAWGRIDLRTLPPAEFIAVSGHKIGAPVGCGLLIARRHLGIAPLFFGGGQQKNIRPGTESTTNAVALATAATCADNDVAASMVAPETGITDAQKRAEDYLRTALPGVIIKGSGRRRAPGICNLSLPSLPRGWLAACKAQLSSGSACSSSGTTGTTDKASHVLQAMGHAADLAANSIRISLPIDATRETWHHLAEVVINGAQQLLKPH